MNRMGVCVAIALPASLAWAADRIPPDVRDHVTRRVDQGYCVGLVVGVLDEQGPSYFSRGRFSVNGGRPVAEDTLFEIGSITKAFTAILLADMAERGQVDLNDPVQKLLPASARVPARGESQITLRDLATHRSGLPRLPDNLEPKDSENPYADYDEEHLLQFLSGHELSRDIGKQYEYSNLGAGLLGHALARSARTTYERLIIDRVCDPLGMSDTRILLSDEQKSRLAQGHAGTKPVKNWDLDALAGAGALRSTAQDMLRFLSGNLGLAETPIAKALQATHRDRFETGQPDLYVALGWHVWTKFGTTILWHNGGTGGYRSFCGFCPEKKLGVVVLTNSFEDIDDIGLHILGPKFELKTLREPTTVDAASLTDYVGHYELRPGLVFEITSEGNQLFAQLTGQDKHPVYPESDRKFFFKVVDAQLSFVRGDDGKIDHLILHQNGDHKARRLIDYKPPVRTEVPLDPAALQKYVGKYELAPGVQFDVTLADGQLKVKLTGQPAFPVYPESETKFFYKVVEAQITFVKDESGAVASLILHQGGRDQTAKRIP